MAQTRRRAGGVRFIGSGGRSWTIPRLFGQVESAEAEHDHVGRRLASVSQLASCDRSPASPMTGSPPASSDLLGHSVTGREEQG